MLKKLTEDKKYILLLVFVLLIMSCAVYKDFIFMNKDFMYADIGADTIASYIPYYLYFKDMLSSKNFSFWSFKLATGNNILSLGNLLFDPFNIILFLFPKEQFAYGLLITNVIKIITSGLLFYMYIRYTKICRKASFIVSLIYAFNGFTILWGQHYFFASFMALLPMVLLGIEKVIADDGINLFCIGLAILAIFSPVMTFMFTFYIFIYAIYRIIYLNGFNIKNIFKIIKKMFFVYILGLGLSSIVFLPRIYPLLNSPRVMSQGLNFSALLNLKKTFLEYVSLLRIFSNNILGIGNNYKGWANYYESPILYCSILTIILLPQIINFSKNKRKLTLAFLGLVIVSLLLPIFNYLFNNFSSYSYRWTFVIICFLIYLLALILDNIFSRSLINKRILIYTQSIFLILFILVLVLSIVLKVFNDTDLLDILYKQSTLILLISSLYFIIIYFCFNKVNNILFAFLTLVVSLELIVNSYITVSNRGTIKYEELLGDQYYSYKTIDVINYLKDKDSEFYRISKNYFSFFLNDPIIQGYNGLTGYNSLNSSSYIDFLKSLEVPFGTNNISDIVGLDERESLQTLMSVKYLLSKNDEAIPVGYSYIDSMYDIHIYENKYFLPLGFTYDSYVDKKAFEELSKEQKDNYLLKGFVPDREYDLLKQYTKLIPETKERNYIFLNNGTGMSIANAIVKENHYPDFVEYISESNDPQIFIPIDRFEGIITINMEIESQQDSNGQVFWADNYMFEEEKSKKFKINKGNNDISLKIPSNYTTLRVDVGDAEGHAFKIKNLIVKGYDAKESEKDIEKLKRNTLSISKFTDGHIIGNINLEDEKMLFLSIPYDKGWNVKVDGVNTKTEKINYGFIGIPLSKGYHIIELKYNPPMFFSGSIITLFSIIMLVYLNKRR